MGTRARVGLVHPDGSITSIYTHWDGYPRHHFPILKGHYNTEKGLRALLDLGDLSILDCSIGKKHNFDARASKEGWCTAYKRDRGEEDVDAITSANFDSFVSQANDTDADYFYLFFAGEWKVWEMNRYGVGSPSAKDITYEDHS